MKLKQIILEEIEKIGNDIILYHGSKYDFNKFDLNKIGTGQHSQDFGYGLYFTTDKETAKFYADELSNFKSALDKYNEVVKSYYDEILYEYIKNDRIVSAKRRLNELIKNNINVNEYNNLLKRLEGIERYAYVYTVRIKNANLINRDNFIELQRKFKLDDRKMNDLLLEKGYNGIVYPMNTKGLNVDKDFTNERNVVIIDDEIIEIINKEKVNFEKPLKLKI